MNKATGMLPSTIITKNLPCAAPARSTDPDSDFNVDKSHDNKSLRQSSSTPDAIVPRALAAKLRT